MRLKVAVDDEVGVGVVNALDDLVDDGLQEGRHAQQACVGACCVAGNRAGGCCCPTLIWLRLEASTHVSR